ncbi:MAG: 16S rRNA (cytosine(967)-C(5))-methyltransferase RsmB [Candidatus Binatia bacterium]
MSKPDSRGLAFEVLTRVETGAFADSTLGLLLSRSDLDERDRALATVFVYGSLSRQLTLDYNLQYLCGRAPARLDRATLVALRLGLFQLFFLDKVPAYAAVNGSVELVRRRSPMATGLVNAVLRRASREGPRRPPDGPDCERLAIETSHPPWLVRTWLTQFGEQNALALMQANNQPAPTVVRSLKSRDDIVAVLNSGCPPDRPCAVSGRLAPDAIRLNGPVDCGSLATPQSEASQLVSLFLAPRRGSRVLDACAAPGGKSAHLASLVGPQGKVVAVDPAPNAAERVANTLRRCALTNVEFHAGPVENFGRLAPFDFVLVDAPCSGLGTLRQHPEIRWRRRPTDIADLAAKQRRILDHAAALLRPGGDLVYSTCTLSATENDELIDGFLADNGTFRENVSSSLHPAVAALVDRQGRLRTYPHLHGTDGFFAARLTKFGER